jgi:hypothetical protein
MFFLGLTRIEKKARRWEKMGVPRGGEAISKVKREKKKIHSKANTHPTHPHLHLHLLSFPQSQTRESLPAGEIWG